MLENSPKIMIIDFLPLYTNRPIVIELDNPLKIPPGSEGVFF